MSVIIIAEAGVNHNGDINLAKKLVEQAKRSGADYVKFQAFQPEKLVAYTAKKAEYQQKATGNKESQLEMLKKLALTQEEFCELKCYCDEQKIGFLSTPFDLDSIDFLEKLNIPLWKIPSGEITNLPYLEKIGKTHKPVILSTGMSTMKEIQDALDILYVNGCLEVTVLHCNTEYPTAMQDVNLLAMHAIREQFNVPVGYSDHTQGIEVPIAATALGASVIEKHFTLDRTMDGPDHRASLEPDELKEMVQAIHNIEKALGKKEKFVTESEMKNKAVARKSIVASKAIKKGERYTVDNLTVKRPGTGISPMQWYHLLGEKADRDYEPDELIKREKENG